MAHKPSSAGTRVASVSSAIDETSLAAEARVASAKLMLASAELTSDRTAERRASWGGALERADCSCVVAVDSDALRTESRVDNVGICRNGVSTTLAMERPTTSKGPGLSGGAYSAFVMGTKAKPYHRNVGADERVVMSVALDTGSKMRTLEAVPGHAYSRPSDGRYCAPKKEPFPAWTPGMGSVLVALVAGSTTSIMFELCGGTYNFPVVGTKANAANHLSPAGGAATGINALVFSTGSRIRTPVAFAGVAYSLAVLATYRIPEKRDALP
mmetsp:Transcript_32130/g.84114  ORF Transcript_32130/g.84114 Transcript_32130/m.84114 type:complete len:270 (-) Transcript_32130:372-1181(-)